MNAVLAQNEANNLTMVDRDHALIIDRVVKRFGGPSRFSLPLTSAGKPVAAIDDVSLAVRRGEIFGVLGANGSGKSTLIRVIATLLLPDGGNISVFGHNVVQDASTVQRMLNRVSVEASLFKKLSAMENLVYAARLYGMDVRVARRRIVDILTALGIPENRFFQPVEKMSRGMQQKVAIARALLTSPILLLLDEPTTGLDPRSKKDVQAFIRDLRDNHDATVLLTSHDMDEADALCDRLVILHRGRVVLDGTPEELKQAYIRRHGQDAVPTLEDVFMDVTGRSSDDVDDDDSERQRE
ncbi:MAG TPA: ABC transporter ATP-binding protein [Chloroflexota bacterium]